MTAAPLVTRTTRGPSYHDAMRAAVDRMDPASRVITAYHLGWTDPLGRPTDANGGKGVRARLALLSSRAAGAPAETGLPGAVAVELVHNFSLLHDDLMDGDEVRRHRPTAWAVFGAPRALLAGDAMLAMAQEVLLDPGTPRGPAAAALLAGATRKLIEGQFADLAFESRESVGIDECLAMVAGKTGALLSASAAIGAVLADADRPTVQALSAYGRHLGVAFQCVDDLLGIWGDPEVTGKPVRSDLRARKKTLPVTYALAADEPAANDLQTWLATQGPDDEETLCRAAEWVERCGGRAWTTVTAGHEVRRAEAALAGLPDGPRDELVALARSLLARQS